MAMNKLYRILGKRGRITIPYRSYKDRNGNMQYSDVAFALNETSRNAVNDAVLEVYEQRLQMEEDESQGLEDQEEDEAPVFEQRM